MDFVQREDMPEVCPKCGTPFDINEDVSYDPEAGGVSATLICSRDGCDYRLRLSFDSEAEIEERLREDDEDDG